VRALDVLGRHFIDRLRLRLGYELVARGAHPPRRGSRRESGGRRGPP
jgi:hypothetical protein